MAAGNDETLKLPPIAIELRLRGNGAKTESIVFKKASGTSQTARPKEGKAVRAVAAVLTMFRRHTSPTLFRVSIKARRGGKSRGKQEQPGSSIVRLILNAVRDAGRMDRGEFLQMGDFLRLFRPPTMADAEYVDIDLTELKPSAVSIDWDGIKVTDFKKLEALAQRIAANCQEPWEVADYNFEVIEAETEESANLHGPSQTGSIFERHFARFSDAVEQLSEATLSVKASEKELTSYYNGRRLNWRVIAAEGDVPRTAMEHQHVMQTLRAGEKELRLVCITGPQGAGKSTLAWRAAASLHKSGETVLHFWQPDDRSLWATLKPFGKVVRRRIFVLVDDLFLEGGAVSALENLDSALDVTVLATSRGYQYRQRIRGARRKQVPALALPIGGHGARIARVSKPARKSCLWTREKRRGIEKRYRMAVLAGPKLPILQSKRRYSSVGRAADL